MQSFKLDKVLASNTDYYTESDTVLVINKIGTDDTAKNTAKVEGRPCAEIIASMAGLVTVAANRLPLFDLGELNIVIPPDKTFQFSGTGSKYIRIVGSILRLAPGEFTPAGFLARYSEQGKKFYSYQYAKVASDFNLAAGASSDLISFTCPTGEKWVFNSLFMSKLLKQAGPAIEYGLASRVLLQDSPLDNLINAKVLLGISQYGTPYPPNDTDQAIGFSFADRPIEVKPGQVLKVQIVNYTGSQVAVDDTSASLIVGVREYL